MVSRFLLSAALLLAAVAAQDATSNATATPALRTGAPRGGFVTPSNTTSNDTAVAEAQQAFDETLEAAHHANASVHANATAATANVTSVEISASADKLLGDFFASGEAGLTPRNFVQHGGNRFTLTVRPYEEAVRITSPRSYTGGRFEFRCKTASVTPGIITAVYMASGHGRTSDTQIGKQDEIDMEWKGNTPKEVQTNVFLAGHDASQVTNLGVDSSVVETDYAIEWDATQVLFYVNGGLVRRVPLQRAMKPMQLQLAVWTTIGGWPGLIQWAGTPDWAGRNNKPATATFEILSVPDEE